MRMSARLALPAGQHQWLLRSLNAARLHIGGKVCGTTRFMRSNADGYEEVSTGTDSRDAAIAGWSC